MAYMNFHPCFPHLLPKLDEINYEILHITLLSIFSFSWKLHLRRFEHTEQVVKVYELSPEDDLHCC